MRGQICKLQPIVGGGQGRKSIHDIAGIDWQLFVWLSLYGAVAFSLGFVISRHL